MGLYDGATWPLADGASLKYWSTLYTTVKAHIDRLAAWAVGHGWAKPGGFDPPAIVGAPKPNIAHINKLRDCAEILATADNLWIKPDLTGAAWADYRDVMRYAEIGGGAPVEWTHVPDGYTDPESGAGPKYANDVVDGNKPYGRWWTELMLFLSALGWQTAAAATMEDGNGNWGLSLYFKDSDATADAVETDWKASVDAQEGLAVDNADHGYAGADQYWTYHEDSGTYYLEDVMGDPGFVPRVWRSFAIPNETEDIADARLIARFNSYYSTDGAGGQAGLNAWDFYAKISTTDPRPYSAADLTDWNYAAGSDLIDGGYQIGGVTEDSLEIVDADPSTITKAATNYVQFRGFEIKPSGLPAGWPAVGWQWQGNGRGEKLHFQWDFAYDIP